MGEEQGLSAENRKLLESAMGQWWPAMFAYAGPERDAQLNRLLDAARSEGLQPVSVKGEEGLDSLGASKAPSSAFAGVAETPSGARPEISGADLEWLKGHRPPGRACKRNPHLCEQRDRIDRILAACGWLKADAGWCWARSSDCQTSGGEA